MPGCNFLFDVIVTHLETTEKIPDPSKLQVTTQFNNKAIKLTASSINVSDFKTTSNLEFNTMPKKLRSIIEECGMPITVTYGTTVLGAGQFILPTAVIDTIDEGMEDLNYEDKCNLEREGKVIGKMQIVCRLTIKCDEENITTASCQGVDKSINQQDILFVMAESQRCPSPCDPCLDALEADEGDDRLKLDIHRYTSHTGGLNRAPDTFIHTPAGNEACCEIKKMALECENIINSVTKSAGLSFPMKPPCRGPQVPDNNFDTQIENLGDENPTLSPYIPCFSYLPARQAEKPDFCTSTMIPVPIGKRENPLMKPIRFCPICLANMSWLPKFAMCPRCGIKPMPVVEDRHKEKKLTADNIILEYLGNSKDNEDYCMDPCTKAMQNKDEDDKCRCTCKFGKKCAHCRIRKLVEDIYISTKSTPACPQVKPSSSEDFNVEENNATECRPYLARVFSELRDLYEIKDTQVVTQQGQKAEPKVPEGAHKTKPKKSPTAEPKPMTCPTTETKQPASNDVPVCVSKKAEDRRAPGLGHQECARRFGGVSRRHGWAWFRTDEADKHGWRPGCVRKSVKRLMNFFLQYPAKNNALDACTKLAEEDKEKERDLPTLNVCKKDGEIFVTLRALNKPNVTMKPIMFKIVKSDVAKAAREIKKRLKKKGFRKCTCHQSIMMCVCRNSMEKKHLECALEKECKRFGVPNCGDQLVLTDTSDSEMEFDFDVSTPAGMPQPPRSGKPRTINQSIQTNKKDLKVPPKYPVPVGPYWRSYDCAAGDRYTGTAFGSPGEVVFEDGVFGFRGGGPHGASAVPGGRAKPPGVWGAGGGGPMRGGGRGGPGGPGGAGGPGGPGGAGGFGFGGKSFPGAPKDPNAPKVKSPVIPVKMTKRYYKALKDAAQAEKDAVKQAIAKKKKGTDLMSYIMAKGTVPTPWNPVTNPKVRDPWEPPMPQPEPRVGEDGLTKGERLRMALLQQPIPPLDSMPRLGKGPPPCTGRCYGPCNPECCYRSYYC